MSKLEIAMQWFDNNYKPFTYHFFNKSIDITEDIDLLLYPKKLSFVVGKAHQPTNECEYFSSIILKYVEIAKITKTGLKITDSSDESLIVEVRAWYEKVMEKHHLNEELGATLSRNTENNKKVIKV